MLGFLQGYGGPRAAGKKGDSQIKRVKFANNAPSRFRHRLPLPKSGERCTERGLLVHFPILSALRTRSDIWTPTRARPVGYLLSVRSWCRLCFTKQGLFIEVDWHGTRRLTIRTSPSQQTRCGLPVRQWPTHDTISWTV
jgi:hypothetical protein